MIRFEIRFPSGRFHATPWGHHVNEGVPEWPPSPWRIARALAASMYTRCPELDRAIALAALRLLAPPPSFSLPTATASHTRHYLSQNKPDRSGRMVFDAFVAVDRTQHIVVHWPVSPSPAERRALVAMASEVSYLGRAEAWCDLRVMGEAEEATAPNCTPSDGAAAERMTTTERVLCPAEGFTEEDLGRTTSTLHEEGWSDPPGTRWVFYRRPSDALSPRSQGPAPTPPAQRPTVAELALGGTVLPLFTDAVRVAERIRRAAMSLCQKPSPVLSGKDASSAARQDQHRHAHYVPEARGKTNRITHVLVYAPEGFGDDEQRALAGITFLDQEHERPRLDVVLAGFGKAGDFEKDSALFGFSRRWRSRTPFVLPRHPKKGKDSPREQLVRELALRGLPAPVAIEPCDGAALFDPGAGEAAKTRWLAFRMRRLRDRGKDGVATAGFGGFEIEFAEKQRGPILLGYGAHYGLGQFEAVRENDGEPGPWSRQHTPAEMLQPPRRFCPWPNFDRRRIRGEHPWPWLRPLRRRLRTRLARAHTTSVTVAQKHSDSAILEPIRESMPPCFRYPDPLTPEDLQAMDELLPDRPTEAILQSIAGEGPDPWDVSSG